MEFEYGRIEPTDSEKDYTIFDISHFAYKLMLRKFNLLYRNHHRKGKFDVLEMGYGIKFTNEKNGCFNHSGNIEEISKYVIHVDRRLLKIHERSNVKMFRSPHVNKSERFANKHVCKFLFISLQYP